MRPSDCRSERQRDVSFSSCIQAMCFNNVNLQLVWELSSD